MANLNTLKVANRARFRPSVRGQNRLTEVERQVQEVGPLTRNLTRRFTRETYVVDIKNDTQEVIPRYGAVELTGVTITPSAHLPTFLERTTFRASKATQDDAQNVAISLDTIPIDRYGRAIVSGVIPARVNLQSTSSSHTRCQLVTDSFELDSSETGASEIIYHPGTGSQTGVDWAQIRLKGGGAGGLVGYPAKVTTEITARPDLFDTGFGVADLYRRTTIGGQSLILHLADQTIFSNWSIAIPVNRWIWVEPSRSDTEGDVWFIVSEDCEDEGTTQEQVSPAAPNGGGNQIIPFTQEPADRINFHVNGITYTPNLNAGFTYPGTGGVLEADWDTNALFVIDSGDEAILEYR